MNRTIGALLSVAVVVAACVGVTEVFGSRSPAAIPTGTRVAVAATESVCPNAESENVSINTSRLSAVVPPAATRSGSGGVDAKAAGAGGGAQARALIARLGQDKPTLKVAKPGSTAAVDLERPRKGDSNAFTAFAAGRLAPGFTVAATTYLDFDQASDGTGQRRGLASETCLEPGTDFWFLGTGADPSHEAHLYLVNPESSPVTLDIDLYSEAGPLSTPAITAAHGIVVDAATARDPINLSVLAAGAKQQRSIVAVHVSVRVGRVAAGVLDGQLKGGAGAGIDWLAPVGKPSTSGVIPGVPGGKGERTLYLFTPQEGAALVGLSLAGRNGVFTPASEDAGPIDSVPLTGGKVTKVDLTGAAQGEPFSVLLRADQPVVASVRVGAASGGRDYGFVPMASPIGGPSVGADVRQGGGYASSILLTAPTGAARANVMLLVEGKSPKKLRDVAVPKGRTVEVPLKGIGQQAAIVVTPAAGSAPLYGSRLMTRTVNGGDMLTIEPLPVSRTTTVIPKVVNDLSAGLRPAEVK